ncbi:hypothetical protein [Nafulsella turpanensis]|uniref:hypothetical protein n=1 Tax=Nafulsella turpanensis TaxID=1265690 RepID=UPI00037217A9|nr:hypothetical protein [Nafulsella turpanensis]
MNKQVKLVVLFFVFLLSYSISIEQVNSARLELTKVYAGSADSDLFILENNPAKILGIHRVHQIIVHSVIPLTGPASKVYLDSLVYGLASFELRTQNIALAFLNDSKKNQLSLNIRTIIFPFHFFW